MLLEPEMPAWFLGRVLSEDNNHTYQSRTSIIQGQLERLVRLGLYQHRSPEPNVNNFKIFRRYSVHGVVKLSNFSITRLHLNPTDKFTGLLHI
tara:strand:+ start:578 stop:856 length:279 start_codon:yes stop_codon:yes gene_type:complete